MSTNPKNKYSPQQLREIFDYDAITGVLRWRGSHSKGPITGGEIAGCLKNSGYIRIQYQRGMLLAHRVAWAIHYGEWPKGCIDHKNRNPGDNRICNLRECSHSQNMMNRTKSSNNKSGFKGVYKDKNAFRAEINVHGKRVRLGRYPTAKEASEAYINAAKSSHSNFACYE